MTKEQLVSYICKKQDEKQRHIEASIYIDALRATLPEHVFNHVQGVISSCVASCDISIRDHERDLERMDAECFK